MTRARKAPIASPEVRVANHDEIEQLMAVHQEQKELEEFIVDPRYEKKKVIKRFSLDLYLLDELDQMESLDDDDYDEEDEDDDYDRPRRSGRGQRSNYVGTFDNLEGYLNATLSSLREQHSLILFTAMQRVEREGLKLLSQQISCTSAGAFLILECEENETTFKARVRNLMLQEEANKKKAKVKIDKAAIQKFKKLPKRVTATEYANLSWTKRMEYNNQKHEIQELKRVAKKYGLALPKEIEEWKG